jgi:hypothetical protein
MTAQLHLPMSPIEQVVNHILTTRRITRADQRRFMATALAEVAVSDQERRQIDRVFEALKKGLLHVVD